ncbi:EutN/CcmL family microcompartment protein [Embleya sp. NPDC055664]|uniref:EutN/CcmL family microcompartment protein n=1 Tax=Embleya sp. NPDC059237 TaxID=3346784 RepID=UPI0036830CF1
MRIGTVTGSVWSTRRVTGVPSGAFLTVAFEASPEVIIAFDVLGTGVGERVLVAQGMSAARRFPDNAPIDALIIGSVDETSTTHRTS